MTYTPEQLERMKRNLGITDEALQPVNVFVWSIGKYLHVKGYMAESEAGHPEIYAVHRADSIEALARHCVDSFDAKGEVNYINKVYKDPLHDFMIDDKFYELTDNEWVDFNSWMEIIKKS
jgi:hypothetical protein